MQIMHVLITCKYECILIIIFIYNINIEDTFTLFCFIENCFVDITDIYCDIFMCLCYFINSVISILL